MTREAPAFRLWAAIALVLAGPGCYPDEEGAGDAAGLRIPLAELAQPLTEENLDAYLNYLREEAAYRDFDFNVPGNSFFLGLHLIRVVQTEPLVEEELGFGAESIRIVTDPQSDDQSLEMDLLLPECPSCYFTLRLFARAANAMQAFAGTSGEFSTGGSSLPPSGGVELNAFLMPQGIARCVDDAQSPATVRLSARDAAERVRLPEVSTAVGAGPPEAALHLPATGPFELQLVDGFEQWRTFAQVAFSYQDQEVVVHFDHTLMNP